MTQVLPHSKPSGPETTSTNPSASLSPHFLSCAATALCVAVLAVLIFERPPGSIVALAYAAPLAVLAWKRPPHAWAHHSVMIFAAAVLATFAIAIEPSFVNMLTGFGFLSAAALASRGYGPNDRLLMAKRMAIDLAKAPFYIVADTLHAIPHFLGLRRSGVLASLVVPVIATGIFAVMLLIANPLFEHLLISVVDRSLASLLSWRLIIVFPLTLALCWSVLREGAHKPPFVHGAVDLRWHELFFKPASVALTLLLLNGVFAVENVLDLKHVWLEGALPAGFTHAQYVHRGAYTLIVTVMMAAGFIMLALRPGASSNKSMVVRGLVYVFAAQNFLLVASSARRTLSYIDDFGMTEWRLAGLIWMGLVALGLALTVWRIVSKRSNHWLINSNLNMAAVLMLVMAFADLRPFIADWNVDRSLAGGSFSDLDASYHEQLGITVIPVLQDFATHFYKQNDAHWRLLKVREVDEACRRIRANTQIIQSHWQSWTLRYGLSGSWDGHPSDGCTASRPKA